MVEGQISQLCNTTSSEKKKVSCPALKKKKRQALPPEAKLGAEREICLLFSPLRLCGVKARTFRAQQSLRCVNKIRWSLAIEGLVRKEGDLKS